MPFAREIILKSRGKHDAFEGKGAVSIAKGELVHKEAALEEVVVGDDVGGVVISGGGQRESAVVESRGPSARFAGGVVEVDWGAVEGNAGITEVPSLTLKRNAAFGDEKFVVSNGKPVLLERRALRELLAMHVGVPRPRQRIARAPLGSQL